MTTSFYQRSLGTYRSSRMRLFHQTVTITNIPS